MNIYNRNLELHTYNKNLYGTGTYNLQLTLLVWYTNHNHSNKIIITQLNHNLVNGYNNYCEYLLNYLVYVKSLLKDDYINISKGKLVMTNEIYGDKCLEKFVNFKFFVNLISNQYICYVIVECYI